MQSATHQAVEQILPTVQRNEEDMQKLKIALLQHLPEKQREEVFILEKHECAQAFEDFCAKLEDPIFNQLVVSCKYRYMISAASYALCSTFLFFSIPHFKHEFKSYLFVQQNRTSQYNG